MCNQNSMWRANLYREMLEGENEDDPSVIRLEGEVFEFPNDS